MATHCILCGKEKLKKSGLYCLDCGVTKMDQHNKERWQKWRNRPDIAGRKHEGVRP